MMTPQKGAITISTAILLTREMKIVEARHMRLRPGKFLKSWRKKNDDIYSLKFVKIEGKNDDVY